MNNRLPSVSFLRAGREYVFRMLTRALPLRSNSSSRFLNVVSMVNVTHVTHVTHVREGNLQFTAVKINSRDIVPLKAQLQQPIKSQNTRKIRDLVVICLQLSQVYESSKTI